MERRNNYELAARQAETLFLNYDQQAVIQSFSLEADADYIYLDFVAKPYRITRRTGALERGPVWTRAGFEEVLSVYDILCHSGKPPVLTGEWLLTGSLRGAASGPSALESPERAAWLAKNLDRIPAACRALGGIDGPGGIRFLFHPSAPLAPRRRVPRPASISLGPERAVVCAL